jgi:hypothetical protein
VTNHDHKCHCFAATRGRAGNKNYLLTLCLTNTYIESAELGTGIALYTTQAEAPYLNHTSNFMEIEK